MDRASGSRKTGLAVKHKTRKPLVVTKVELSPGNDAASRLRRVFDLLLRQQNGVQPNGDSNQNGSQTEQKGGANMNPD